MASGSASGLPQDAQDVLNLLRLNHNVLVSGPPGTGKSRLLADVARGFKDQLGGPAYVKTARVAIPPSATPAPYMPSPGRKNRAVFPTVMHSGTKPRDLLRGVVPAIDPAAAVLKFEVTEGTLYRASEHALQGDGAALLIVDELNRGPAVAVFGPAIVALEGDKRLDDSGAATDTTQHFEILDDNGRGKLYALPTHLYILAAMNQADTSVEAIDVAFLRRFAPYLLTPDPSVALVHFGLASDTLPSGMPSSAAEVYATLVAAWRRVNGYLRLARGSEYQIGHGVLMVDASPPTGLPEAVAYAARGWQKIRQHIDEVFFGDTRSVGQLLGQGRNGSPYELEETTFAGQPVVQLKGPVKPAGDVLLKLLRAVAES